MELLKQLLSSTINIISFTVNTYLTKKVLNKVPKSVGHYQVCLHLCQVKATSCIQMMITCLKECAAAASLVLNPKIISCDFGKGAIKAFKVHFPGVKIQGCHFHFTSAIHKKGESPF